MIACSCSGPMGVNGAVRESQGSDQILVCSPFPMALPRWFFNKSLPMQIPRHPCEAELGTWQSRKVEFLQYFPMRVFANRHEGFVKSLQLIFAKRESLKLWMSLKPSPPSLFDKRDKGILKQDIVYVGIAANTERSIVVLPAEDRNLEDQLIALCRILSTMPVKRSFFFLPNSSGRPRIFRSSRQFESSDLQKNIVSSANRRWEILGHFFATLMPVKFPASCALLHRPDRTSLQRMKRYGERGSPCLMPLCGVTDPCADPFKRKE